MANSVINRLSLKALFKEKKIWSLSNVLSGLRGVAGVLLYWLILNDYTFGAIVLGILAIISDYADGYFARKRNEISELGKILDPAADKFAVALGAIALYQVTNLPLWVLFVIIGRDILIVIGSLILMQKVQHVESSEIPGKIAVTIISLLLLSYLFNIKFAQQPLLILTVISIIFSFLSYVIKFLRKFNNPQIE